MENLNTNFNANTPKRKRQTKQVNYSEIVSGGLEDVCSTDSGRIKRLMKQNFTPYEVKILKGNDFNKKYFEKCGFQDPILVPDKEGLGLKVPPPDFSVADVAELVGLRYPVNVIETSSQSELLGWNMEEWSEYYAHKQSHHPILNVISLEFSSTKLKDLILSPMIVRELDWIDHAWPKKKKEDNYFPQVQFYCLMSVGGAYTDFHVDFGGTSVWYHVLKGKKVFLLIEPSQQNLLLYKEWICSPDQLMTFFADKVSECFKVEVNAGATFFIPSGWIHAVFTPEDSLVFGGNFLHEFSIGRQLDIFNLEISTHIAEKFQFPYFRSMMMFAASWILQRFKKSDYLCDHVVADLPRLISMCRAQLRDGRIPEADVMEAALLSGSTTPLDMLDELEWRMRGLPNFGPASESNDEQTQKPTPKLKLKLKKPSRGQKATTDSFLPRVSANSQVGPDGQPKEPATKPKSVKIRFKKPVPSPDPVIVADPQRLKFRVKLSGNPKKEQNKTRSVASKNDLSSGSQGSGLPPVSPEMQMQQKFDTSPVKPPTLSDRSFCANKPPRPRLKIRSSVVKSQTTAEEASVQNQEDEKALQAKQKGTKTDKPKTSAPINNETMKEQRIDDTFFYESSSEEEEEDRSTISQSQKGSNSGASAKQHPRLPRKRKKRLHPDVFSRKSELLDANVVLKDEEWVPEETFDYALDEEDWMLDTDGGFGGKFRKKPLANLPKARVYPTAKMLPATSAPSPKKNFPLDPQKQRRKSSSNNTGKGARNRLLKKMKVK